MRYQKIVMSPTDDIFVSRIGGLPLLETSDSWPLDPNTGRPLLLLATIQTGFLSDLFPQFAFADEHCISIFVCFDSSSRICVRRLAIQEQSQIEKIGNEASKVILHKRSRTPCDPPNNAPKPLAMLRMKLNSPADEESDPSMPDRGTIFSKVGGIPGWAQDPIDLPGYTYVLQISEHDIWRINPGHAGLLANDTGFLFLRSLHEFGESGAFFIQFS